MKVRLTKKLAERIDGVYLGDRHVGDVLDLRPEEARLLIAEQWATAEQTRLALVPSAPTRPSLDARHPSEIEDCERAS
jgi:hypothetical protein